MTPLKVNRTLPLCLRRNLLLHGLNRPVVSTLSSLAAAHPPPKDGAGRGTQGFSVYQPRVEQMPGGPHSEHRISLLLSDLGPHVVCAWGTPPIPPTPTQSWGPLGFWLSEGLQGGLQKAQGLALVAVRAAAWPAAGCVVRTP